MNTYVFVWVSANSLTVTIKAQCEEDAWAELENRLNSAVADLGFSRPVLHRWELITAC